MIALPNDITSLKAIIQRLWEENEQVKCYGREFTNVDKHEIIQNRQVFDLAQAKLEMTEHQLCEIYCCGVKHRGEYSQSEASVKKKYLLLSLKMMSRLRKPKLNGTCEGSRLTESQRLFSYNDRCDCVRSASGCDFDFS
jgi:hypothetical protein